MRNRKSIRLSNYNYSHPGAYFITVCAIRRECLFGEICNGTMYCNTNGNLVAQSWQTLPQRFAGISLDAFIVMPNHVHGIICIDEGKGAASGAPTTVTPSLGNIVRAFKSISAIAVNRLLQRENQSMWQRNYYERIIRTDDEWNRIREYIANNPTQWNNDVENPLRTT